MDHSVEQMVYTETVDKLTSEGLSQAKVLLWKMEEMATALNIQSQMVGHKMQE